jgi:hypothetical protein
MSTKTSIPLALDDDLVKEKIVVNYACDVKNSSFVLELGDGYGGKTITSPIDVDD